MSQENGIYLDEENEHHNAQEEQLFEQSNQEEEVDELMQEQQDEQYEPVEGDQSNDHLPALMQLLQGQGSFQLTSQQHLAALHALVLGNQAANQLAQSQSQNAGEDPYFVNVKQYYRILRRREARARWFARFAEKRSQKGYIHESRHIHAVKRPRDANGRFLKRGGQSDDNLSSLPSFVEHGAESQ